MKHISEVVLGELKIYQKTGMFILNLDEASDPGAHWVAVYHNEYCDSFGLPPPKCIEKRIDWYNTRHQKVNSSLCGLYSCYYIICRNRGQAPYEIYYKKLKKGENISKLL